MSWVIVAWWILAARSSLFSLVQGAPVAPQLKRGPLAWQNASRDNFQDDEGEVNRLLVHSVTSATSHLYLPEVRKYLLLLRGRGVTYTSVDRFDRLLMLC